MGEGFDRAEHINGFRFISPKTEQSFYRVEIWVDFNDSDIDTVSVFSSLLTELFNTLNFDFKIVRFLNNKVEPKQERERGDRERRDRGDRYQEKH